MSSRIVWATLTLVGAVLVGIASAAVEAKSPSLHTYCTAHPNFVPVDMEGSDDAIPADAPVDRPASWRCADGKVMLCYQGASGDACVRTRPVDAARQAEFIKFCRTNPGADLPHSLTMGLHSNWRCNGRTAEKTGSWPLDSRGFVDGAWEVWLAPATKRTSVPPQAPARASRSVFSIYWPIGGGKVDFANKAPCGDWPGEAEGCWWLGDVRGSAATRWRDVNRFQAFKGPKGYHLGADLNLGSGDGDIGLPVYAITDGVVLDTWQNQPGWGNAILLRHDINGNVITSLYAHIQWLDGVPPANGTRVAGGQQIAKVGKGSWTPCKAGSACSYPAHLHFELRDGQQDELGRGYTQTQIPENTAGPQRQVEPINGLLWLTNPKNLAPPAAPEPASNRVSGTVLPALTRLSGTGACRISLDPAERQIAGYDVGGGWYVGINGTKTFFPQRNFNYDQRTGAFSMATADRKTVIRLRPLRQISSPRADGDVLAVDLTVNGTSTTIQAYRFCDPGD